MKWMQKDLVGLACHNVEQLLEIPVSYGIDKKIKSCMKLTVVPLVICV